jgi:hypothetical protein
MQERRVKAPKRKVRPVSDLVHQWGDWYYERSTNTMREIDKRGVRL